MQSCKHILGAVGLQLLTCNDDPAPCILNRFHAVPVKISWHCGSNRNYLTLVLMHYLGSCSDDIVLLADDRVCSNSFCWYHEDCLVCSRLGKIMDEIAQEYDVVVLGTGEEHPTASL